MKFFTIAIAAFFVACSSANEVCYDDLGCFSNDYPFADWGRVAVLPESPEEIQTRFLLYTRRNANAAQQIVAKDVDSLRRSYFNASLPVKFIAHGFIDGEGIAEWMGEMAEKFLIHEDLNVFVIDWAKGSRALYSQASANTRVVGAQLAQMVDFLVAETGSPSGSRVHIIGHSLGAHIAGYAGERIPGLARITGMDPAGPYFQDMQPAVRIDESDAVFVDIIHTDGSHLTTALNPFDDMMGLGLMQKVGHVDVYPNGGEKQPGCGDKGPIQLIIGEGIVEGVRELVCCGHMRSVYYTSESIASSCPWRSYKCAGGYEEFKTGRCLRCPDSGDKTIGCNSVATVATKPSDGSVNNEYFMITSDKSPFCLYHYHINLKIDNHDNKNQKGLVWVNLYGEYGTETGRKQLGNDNFEMKPGHSYDFLITSPVGISAVTAVEVKWEHDASLLDIGQWQWGTPTIFPGHVNVFSGEHQTEVRYCDTGRELESKQSRRLVNLC